MNVSNDHTASIRCLAAEEETLKMKASRSSKTLVIIYQSTQCNIPEDFTLQYLCGNLKFRLYQLVEIPLYQLKNSKRVNLPSDVGGTYKAASISNRKLPSFALYCFHCRLE
jgi:hypothetical protein